MTPDEKINHPFYCVWCGKIFPDKSTFEAHYKEEISDEWEFDVMDAVYNDKHY